VAHLPGDMANTAGRLSKPFGHRSPLEKPHGVIASEDDLFDNELQARHHSSPAGPLAGKLDAEPVRILLAVQRERAKCESSNISIFLGCYGIDGQLCSTSMSDVTRILSAIEQGDPRAAEQLLPLVYDELRKLAAVRLSEERPGQTLQATALVHEAYLRLVGGTQPQGWNSRGHFFAAAAEAMRRILVERARRKGRVRHGGGLRRAELLDEEVAAPADDAQLLLLDSALTRLAAARPQAVELVKLRFFAGLTLEEIAPLLSLSPRSARRLWAFARAWLRRDMERSNESAS
jgi:RNA polymerase sigma factor (TIGR02999 family)